MKIKSINKIKNLFILTTLIGFKSISAQEKKPLENINVTEILMHLDWPRMNYFDDQNKVVDPVINDGRVVFTCSIPNKKDFWPKINILKGKYCILKIDVIHRL